MKYEEIKHEIETIRHLAESQRLTVQRGGSAQFTEEVLKEIVRKCDAIKLAPAKSLAPDPEFVEELKVFIDGAVGFCEATREEYHGIWARLTVQRQPPVSWTDGNVGRSMTIGYLDSRPVHVQFYPTIVAGHKVVFYNATSTVVDHDMIRDFLDMIAPATAMKSEGVVNHADAANMTTILPSGWHKKDAV